MIYIFASRYNFFTDCVEWYFLPKTGIKVFLNKIGYTWFWLAAIDICSRVGVKYSTCTWYLYSSTYLSVLDVLEYLVYGNVKVLVLDQKVLGTYK